MFSTFYFSPDLMIIIVIIINNNNHHQKVHQTTQQTNAGLGEEKLGP